MADVFCNRCGHRNHAGSNFCSSCGQPLDHASAEPSTITIKLDQIPGEDEVELRLDQVEGTAVLVATRGPNAGSEFAIRTDRTTIGRHPESDIFLDDVTVSRRHVEVEREGDRYTVQDVGSLNGTYLNRKLIEGPTPLANGDEIQVGLFKLVFVTAPER